MQPTLDVGDLVLTRPALAYAVGDVIAIRRGDGPVVVHRVVATDGAIFTTRGDANPTADPDRTTSDEIIGRMALRVPAVGRFVAYLRDGGSVSVLVGLLVFLVGLGYLRNSAGSSRPRPEPARAQHASRRQLEHLSVATSIAGLVVLGIGMFGPLRQAGSQRITYRTAFATGGKATPGVTYPGGVVADGQPFFLDLVERARVSVRTVALAPDGAAVGAGGRWRMDATLGASSGWSQVIPMGRGTLERGRGHGLLDLADLKQRLLAFEQETGEREGTYPVTVRAALDTTTSIAGVAVAQAIASTLEMRFDGRRLTAADGNGVTPVETTGSVLIPNGAPGTMMILGRAVPTRLVRIVGAGLLPIGAAFGLASVVVPLVRVEEARATLQRRRRSTTKASR